MTVLAHAFGARYDLPIPLYLFVLGGALVVIASFLIVLPRGHDRLPDTQEEVTDGAHLRGLHPLLGALALAWLGFLCWCGIVGNQEVAENLLPTVFWLIVWIAVPLIVAIVGDWTQPVNPYAFLGKLADSDRARRALLGSPQPISWPRWLGWWPAVVLFFVAACSELIFNLTTTVPHFAAEALAGYAGISLLGGFLFGKQWLRRGEMFTVLFDTWGRLGFFRFGAPGRRGFAGGLEVGFARRASRLAFVQLILLNVNFDGLLSTPHWANVLRNLPGSAAQPGTAQHWFNVVVFALMTVVLAFILTGFAQGSAVAGEHRSRPLSALVGLLPSLVPIAFGYLFAHNVEYLVLNGQLLLPLIGNPPGLDSWPLHLPYPFNDDYEPNIHVLPSSFYWYLSVVVIIAVHVYAVVISHRHLVRVGRDEPRVRRSEYPWLVAMVGYTCLSLWLLAQPLTETSSTTSGNAGGGSSAAGAGPAGPTVRRVASTEPTSTSGNPTAIPVVNRSPSTSTPSRIATAGLT
jgi:hypothetical protein